MPYIGTKEAVEKADEAMKDLNHRIRKNSDNYSHNSPQLCAAAQISIAHSLHAIMLLLRKGNAEDTL
jgi:hypothetical protein